MPVYEYRCEQCGTRFEQFVHLSTDSSPKRCPRCGAAQTRKQFSIFSTASTTSGTSSAPGPGQCAPHGG